MERLMERSLLPSVPVVIAELRRIRKNYGRRAGDVIRPLGGERPPNTHPPYDMHSLPHPYITGQDPAADGAASSRRG